MPCVQYRERRDICNEVSSRNTRTFCSLIHYRIRILDIGLGSLKEEEHSAFWNIIMFTKVRISVQIYRECFAECVFCRWRPILFRRYQEPCLPSFFLITFIQSFSIFYTRVAISFFVHLEKEK